MTVVHASEELFPTLYNGATKAVFVGQTLAHSLSGAERLPVRFLRATGDGGRNELRLEGPSSLDSGPLRRLSIPPANVWCVCAASDGDIRKAELLIAWWKENGGTGSVPALWTGTPAALER